MNNLDRAVNNDFLVVSKTLLPYLGSDRQRPIAIFIKVMELIYTINLYSDEKAVRSMSRSQDAGWERSFLSDVKNNLSPDKAYFVDAILKLTEARSLLSKQEQYGTNNYYSPSDYHLHPDDSGIPENEDFPDMMKPSSYSNNAGTSSSSTSTNPNPEQLINSLSSMLDPNQAQLLKTLTSILMPQQSRQ